MSHFNDTSIAFRPPSRADFSQRAKAVAQILGVTHGAAQQFLSGLYGYPDLRTLQIDADLAENCKADAPPGPYRRWRLHDEPSAHIVSYTKRYLGLATGQRLVRALRLANIGLYDRAENMRRLLKWQMEMEVESVALMGKGVLALTAREKRLPPKKTDVFHQIEIAGRNFYGVVRHDLYLADDYGKSAYIGPSVITYLASADVAGLLTER